MIIQLKQQLLYYYLLHAKKKFTSLLTLPKLFIIKTRMSFLKKYVIIFWGLEVKNSFPFSIFLQSTYTTTDTL